MDGAGFRIVQSCRRGKPPIGRCVPSVNRSPLDRRLGAPGGAALRDDDDRQLQGLGRGRGQAQPVPQFRALEAGVSVLPLVMAGGLSNYLANFAVQADEFASVYAVYQLLEAHERGENVPADMLLGHVSNFINGPRVQCSAACRRWRT